VYQAATNQLSRKLPNNRRELQDHHNNVQESPADARITRDSAVIPRWPSAAILDIIEPEIAPFDPPTPKTLA